MNEETTQTVAPGTDVDLESEIVDLGDSTRQTKGAIIPTEVELHPTRIYQPMF